ncbi:hypothetical protein DPEC_G00014470 [Dallia pectoralis]|uniref:Uncharacterized protein n=1 Tax=Dallia pectoralis TaxID=75939 RepID=A0ACC2HN31_DALPE|nr:hypothetical protein DPEC_G00014470 [Dallia pectoralis]
MLRPFPGKQETDLLNQQVDIISHAIEREGKATELELQARLFSYREYKATDQSTLSSVFPRSPSAIVKSIHSLLNPGKQEEDSKDMELETYLSSPRHTIPFGLHQHGP